MIAGVPQDGCEAFVAFDREGFEQGGFVRVMAVAGGMADTGPAGDFAEGEAVEARLCDHVEGDVEQNTAQVAVVVGPGGLLGHGNTSVFTKVTLICYVNYVNTAPNPVFQEDCVRTAHGPSAQSYSTPVSRRSSVLLAGSTLLGLLHHTDHVLRVEHSGWAFIAEVTPFTFSLLVYFLVALTWLNLRRPRRAASLVIFMLILTSLAHLLIELPGDQYGPWADGHNLLHLSSAPLGIAAMRLAAALMLTLLLTAMSLLGDARQPG